MNYHKGKLNKILYYSTALLHLIYLAVFIHEHIKAFVWLNIILAFVYIYLGKSTQGDKISSERIIACALPIDICIICHFVVFGPNLGFQYLAISLIPLIFYLIYTGEHKLALAVRLSIGAAIISFGLIVAGALIDYPLKIASMSKGAMLIILIINLIGAMSISVAFMLAFAMRVMEDKGNLENQTFDLENTANKDALTGVRNRRTVESYIKNVIHTAVSEGKDFTMFMCDIDDFKKVNDTYGHDCGDQVLKKIAETFIKELRPEDAIFRWGGEEFLIIVNAGGSVAKRIAERCRKAIESSSLIYNDNEIKVTITIGGVSFYQGATRDSLVTRADENLYKGKHNGKNQVVI